MAWLFGGVANAAAGRTCVATGACESIARGLPMGWRRSRWWMQRWWRVRTAPMFRKTTGCGAILAALAPSIRSHTRPGMPATSHRPQHHGPVRCNGSRRAGRPHRDDNLLACPRSSRLVRDEAGGLGVREPGGDATVSNVLTHKHMELPPVLHGLLTPRRHARLFDVHAWSSCLEELEALRSARTACPPRPCRSRIRRPCSRHSGCNQGRSRRPVLRPLRAT